MMAKELLGGLELNRIYQRDCLSDGGMVLIPDKSIDMILCDLPYGTTACKWDTIIPFEQLWAQYERIIKDNGAIVLTASQPFTSALVMSNPKLFRYEWIWRKDRATLFQHANKMPMKKHENVLVFYKKLPTYNPQFSEGKPYKDLRTERKRMEGLMVGGAQTKKSPIVNEGKRYPTSDLFIPCEVNRKHNHPTQKPVDLFEYLIRTYTNEGNVILDNCMGSGTTAVATLNVGGGRKFIGFETEPSYIEIANKRIDDLR
jgi:site-specific DNA-methyltransferase (adenine-specific)